MIGTQTALMTSTTDMKSATYPWETHNPLALLAGLQGRPRWAWLDPHETVIAWGQAAVIQGEDIEAQLAALGRTLPEADVRLFGGLPFDPAAAPDPLWGDFSRPGFILPQYIYRQSEQKSTLTVIGADPAAALAAAQQAMQQSPLWREGLPALPEAHLESGLSYVEWQAMVLAARRQAQAGQIQKVVFARTLEVTFERQPALTTAFAHLVERYPGTYRFYFEPTPGQVFFGATPELLLQVQGRQLETTALAGSARRGQTAAEDDALGAELLACAKNRREQAIVVERICDELRPLCHAFELPKTPRLRQLPNIQHLETPIRASLKQPGILAPAQALHPTPALAGQPRPAALALIRQYEPVSRGGYGAPVGWITPGGDGRLAVAIRSGVFQGQRGRLYAGAGLLAESEPQKEWEETALKFRPMLEALRLTEKAL